MKLWGNTAVSSFSASSNTVSGFCGVLFVYVMGGDVVFFWWRARPLREAFDLFCLNRDAGWCLRRCDFFSLTGYAGSGSAAFTEIPLLRVRKTSSTAQPRRQARSRRRLRCGSRLCFRRRGPLGSIRAGRAASRGWRRRLWVRAPLLCMGLLHQKRKKKKKAGPVCISALLSLDFF
jgi:hypothetical protein